MHVANIQFADDGITNLMTYSNFLFDSYYFPIESPETRQFTSFNVTCDTSNGTYHASVTFNDDETGGSDINYYNGTVTGPSGFSSPFNVTTNTVVITGLQCSTSYIINVTAVNCAGVSTVKATSFTTPQPGKCCCVTILNLLNVLSIQNHYSIIQMHLNF